MTATFQAVFDQWYDYYSRTVENSTSFQTLNAMSRYVLPKIGKMNISEIRPRLILDLAHAIAEHSTYYATRTVAVVMRVIDYAVIVLEVLEMNHIARLARYMPSHVSEGFRFADEADWPRMFRDIERAEGSAHQIKAALWVLIYTSLRRSEVALARKSEFDFNKKLWTIPASRMKIKSAGDHVVPLADSVISILESCYNNNTDFMFAAINDNKPINPWSLRYPVKKSGWLEKQTLHGFRKIFSTHAHESRKWTIDGIELCLAHKMRGVRAVYNHANMLDERTELMQWYANEVNRWRGLH